MTTCPTAPETLDLIFAYTRANAIADGVLVDVTATAREAGFRFPVAMTAAAWADCVAWDAKDNARKGTCQDQDGRLWDVLWMASLAVRAAKNGGSRTMFRVLRTKRAGKSRRPVETTLVIACGPGDDAEPVLTIMLPNED